MSLAKLSAAAFAALVSIIPISQNLMAAEPASIQSFVKRAEKGDSLNVVFFGGSLTWGANASDPLLTSWRGLMMQYLTATYPKAHFHFFDAAIGGTGSALGLYRLERDVLKHQPDLVFLDFTMNDGADGKDVATLAAYEHLVRSILESGSALQPVITTFKFFVDKPEVPVLPRIDDHLKLAEAYGLKAANIHQAIRDQIAAKQADVNVLWPFDGAHPDDPGYALFFKTVLEQFQQNAADASLVPKVPTETVFENRYPKVERQILVDQTLPKGWSKALTRRTSLWFDGLPSRWMGDVAEAKVVDGVTPEPLEIKFKGSMVGLFGERDSVSVPFKAWIDGEPVAVPQPKPKKGEEPPPPNYVWETSSGKFSPPKAGTGVLFSWILLSNKLTDGEHTLKIEPIFEGADPKANLRIESVCSAGR